MSGVGGMGEATKFPDGTLQTDIGNISRVRTKGGATQIVSRWANIGVRGFPARGYFIPGRDGTGVWHISRVVCVSARSRAFW